jgi:hypothetical protein
MQIENCKIKYEKYGGVAFMTPVSGFDESNPYIWGG